jgi:acyl carrier protein
MEMTGCLEEKLQIRIPDEELAEVETLGELDTLIRRVIAGKEAP